MINFAGKDAFLKYVIRIHAARCRPSMADNDFKKASLPAKLIMWILKKALKKD
jgi:hypothetical protein